MTVLDEARDLVQRRLSDIEEERGRLERALAELGTDSKPAQRRGRPSRTKRTRKGRTGGRADQAVALIAKKPGISASEIARKLKIKPNYLYRVLGDLEKQGRVKKDGRAYSPA
jgi:sugar-specific transcriptional regulator TrmB